MTLTLPSEWIAITQADAKDTAKIAGLKAVVPAAAKTIDAMVAAMGQHPEYWFVAARDKDNSIVTAQVRDAGTFASWSTQEEAALKQAYTTVETKQLTTPIKGVAYVFTANGLATEVVGVERATGAAVFSFVSQGATETPADWIDALASYSEAGS
jgi:hypothetical protein